MTLRADLVPAEHGTKVNLAQEASMSQRLQAPSLDRHCVKKIEMEFEIPVYLTADQMEMLHYIMKEICSDPQNTPMGRTHEITNQGPKPLFSLEDAQSVGPDAYKWDETTLYFGSSVK